MLKVMIHTGKQPERAAEIVQEHGGSILADYGQAILARISADGVSALNEVGYRTRELPTREKAQVAGFELDTARPSGISTNARAAARSLPSGRSHHILRLVGPMHPNWKTQLEWMGLIFYQSLGADQYLISVDSARVEAVRALDFVEALSPYYPALKVNQALLTEELTASLAEVEALSRTAPPPRPRGARRPPPQAQIARAQAPPLPDPQAVGNIEIVLFDQQDLLTVASAVRDMGAKVFSANGTVVVAYATQEVMPQIAALPQVRVINPYRPPQLTNNVATGILHATPLHENHGLDGSGQVIAVADTGLDTGDPTTILPDFRDRLISIYALGRPGDPSDIHNHGTHVAGSALGDGDSSNGAIRGIAPAAGLVFQSTMDAYWGLGGLPFDLADGLFDVADADGAHIHTNSWSAPLEGAYTDRSEQADSYAFNHREFMILFAAGNWVPLENGDWLTGIGAPGTAKNVLTVGASESVRPLPGTVHVPGEPPNPFVDDEADDPNDVSWFSCLGPAQNDRQKPDVVAPGSWILSTRSTVSVADSNQDGVWTHAEAVGRGLPGGPIFGTAAENTPPLPAGAGAAAADNHYYSNGTSMSTPLTAGSCALLRQYLVEQRGHTPSAALLKALIVNGAVDMGMGVPHNGQGWGRVDLTHTLFPPGASHVQFDDDLSSAVSTGQIRAYDVWVSSPAHPLSLTLVWRDPPGDTIQNELYLRVIHVDSGTEASIENITDIRNNVQKIVLETPQAGRYRIEVEALNVATPIPEFAALSTARQDFALVVAGATGFSCAPSDVVQVIDRSGSMGYSGYMEPAKERAKQMVDILQINDRAGIVTFAESAVEEMELTPITSQEDKDTAHALIDLVEAGGMTDLREAIEQGLETLGPSAGRPQALILLSDGKHTVATPGIDDAFLDSLASLRVKVYTIALGSASDLDVLNEIAERTGTGAAYVVESAADLHKLHEIYYDIVGSIGCGYVTHLASAQLDPGHTMQRFANVSRIAREAFFAASWAAASEAGTDAEVRFTLRSPSGTEYTPASVDAAYCGGRTHAFYRVAQPEAGAWALNLAHENEDGSPLQVTTAAMADGGVQLVTGAAPHYLYKDKLLIRLLALYNGQPLIRGQAKAAITYPTQPMDVLLDRYKAEIDQIRLDADKLAGDADDARLLKLDALVAQYAREGKDLYEREQVEIELRDDGQERDPKPDDGIYTAFFDPKLAGVAGSYQIKATFAKEDDELGTLTCTKLIPIYVPRPEPVVKKLIIQEIVVRRSKLWPYIILGARVAHADGSTATPQDGVSVQMDLFQLWRRVKSPVLPYYAPGKYFIWRLDWKQAGFKRGMARLVVHASRHGFLVAQESKIIRLY